MNTSDSRKNKWIVGGAILVMLLAGGSILRLRSLQRQASPGDLKAQQKAMIAATEARLALSPEEQAHRLELVTRLRDTWKPWAEAHQSELRQMLAAKSSDARARDAVWNAVPDDPLFSAHMVDFSNALNANGNSSKGEVFTWNAVSRPRSSAQMNAMAADVRDRSHREQTNANWALQNDFAQQRDIVISQSLQTGTVSVSLWASGRVTEDTIGSHTKPQMIDGVGVSSYKRKEVLPPYDFLTSK